jgi:molybdenum cofactor cytidylyltransferase
MQGFVVLNEDFASGLASSIRTAIHHLDAVAAGVLLLLADQPLVDAAQLEKLAESCTTNPGRIIASAYAGTIGPPVIFPREFCPELVDLSGDQGAKPVLERHRQLLITIKCEAAAVDIDHREDLGTR